MTDSALVQFEHGDSSAAQAQDLARENATLEYWRTVLAGAPREIELPTDRSRPALPAKRQAFVVTTVPSSVAQRIVTIGHQRNCLPFVTLLAAFCVLLQRSTGQTDLLVGIPQPRHVWPGGESLTYGSAQSRPVRIQSTADETFPSLLSKVDAAIVGMLAHADIPLDAPNPFFNVTFDFDESPQTAFPPHADQPGSINDESGLDLAVVLRSGPDGSFHCLFGYNTDLFERATIDVLAGHFNVLLDSIAADASATLGRLAMASAAELDVILNVWGRPDNVAVRAPAGDGSRTIDELIALNAAQRPDATALVEGDGARVTYGELDRRANGLAHALRARGVARDVRVGLYLERSASAVIAMLATLKAGGGYVPLDPTYPPERTAFMLASANVEAIVTQRRWYAALEAYAPLLCDIDDPAHSQNPAEHAPLGNIDPDSLAYVMFTSGSTGRPNAAAIAHRSLMAFATRTPALACTPDDSVLLHATLTFDASILMIWPPLAHGARIAIMPATPFSLAEFAAQLNKQRITLLWMVSPLFHQIVEERLDALRDLRCCIVGGDVVSPVHSRRFITEIPQCRLFNGYGPTETTVFASLFEVTPDAVERRSVPIGRPCAEARIAILDQSQEPVEIGVPGELWIGGSGLARGYLNNPELTRQRFIRDPFSTDPAGRLYRSGDRARWLPSGDIEFLGRTDAQVKIRGFRIEPPEIEFAMLEHPAIRHAAVVVRGKPAERFLVAYAEVRDSGLTEAALRPFLQTKLPPHAIPSRLILLDSLPKTGSDKIDRQALPEPSARPMLVESAVPAGDELQQNLVRLWEALLGVHPVGIHDDFFALGGDSLLAARLVGDIERQFGVRLPLAILFEQSTVEQLADALCLDPASLNRSPIAAFNAAGTQQPFFYLHGSLAGGGYYCSALAKNLGADRPMFAMRPHGVDGGPIPPTIEMVAAECIRALKSVIPHGPYLLGGWSSAGLVAFEMARQLVARGEHVDNVLMIDAPHAGNTLRAIVEFGEGFGRRVHLSAARGEALRAAAARLACHLVLRSAAARDKREYLELTIARIQTALDPQRHRRRAEAAARASAGTEELQYAWERISDAYVPRRYAGRLTVIMPEEEPHSRIDARGWLSVTRKIAICSVPGNHLSCLTEHIEATAKQMSDSMSVSRG